MYTGIHHLAFITNDLDRTIRFYRDLLGFPLTVCLGDDEFKHYFFQLSPTDHIAFFAYDEARPMHFKFPGRPTDEPRGYDHVAIGVDSKAQLFELKDRLEAADIEVTGPVDHGIGWSIYFQDPNHIPLEIMWHHLELAKTPAMSDDTPPETAREGSAPQPDKWPAVTRPTPRDQWTARPGAGNAIRDVVLRDGGKAHDE